MKTETDDRQVTVAQLNLLHISAFPSLAGPIDLNREVAKVKNIDFWEGPARMWSNEPVVGRLDGVEVSHDKKATKCSLCCMVARKVQREIQKLDRPG